MQIATRMKDLKPSLTIALGTKAKEIAQRERVYNLAVGEPNFPAPAPAIEAATRVLASGCIRYSAAGGTKELRQAIVDKYQRENQLEFDIDEVVAGCGVKELLLHAFMATLNAGDEVLLVAPYWPSYLEQVKIAGGVPVVIPCARGFPSSDRLEQYASANTKAIVLNYPNNPSGYVPQLQQWQELGSYLSKKDWWIFSDEIYEYFHFSSAKHISPLNVCPDLRARIVVFNGMSKGFGMTGWRVGYALGDKQLISQIKKLQSQSTTCLPSFTEEAARAVLAGGYELVRKQIDAIRVKRGLALQLLTLIADISFVEPAGAFFIFIQLPSWLPKSKTPTALLFSEWLLHNYKVIVVPGEAFGVDNHIRISCGAEVDDLRVGLELLAEGLKKLKR